MTISTQLFVMNLFSLQIRTVSMYKPQVFGGIDLSILHLGNYQINNVLINQVCAKADILLQ
jgi:hypothetical protein